MNENPVTLEKIRQAAVTIRTNVIRTPLVSSPTFSRMFGGQIYLKLENLQKTGSFKIRGAMNRILSSLKQISDKGVVAASAGNHAQGVALAAKMAGVPSTIVMPLWASITKQQATRAYGGQVVLSGETLSESLETAKRLSSDGMTFVHPFDEPAIICGQGSIALEILKDLSDTDMIIVPVGGGGLISGIAAAAKEIRPKIRVVGVQARACPSAYESLKVGKPQTVESYISVADGINVRQTGRMPFDLIQKYVDEIVLVEEEQIATAILTLLERKKILAEGAGATPLAALMRGSVVVPPDHKAVLIISGGNLDSPVLGRIINKGLVINGRIMRIKVVLKDRPGALSDLLKLVSGMQANILNVYHDRNIKDMQIHIANVVLEMETRNPDHIDEIATELQNSGYEIEFLE